MDHFWNKGERPRFSPLAIVGMVVGGVVLAAGLAFLFGWIVMLLWNWLMPDIFKLPRIGYWQAWGLVLLSHILIKPGFGDHGGDHKGSCGGERRKARDKWKERVTERNRGAGDPHAEAEAGERPENDEK